MNDLIDYRTLAFVLAVKGLLQVLGLLYVWYAERKYAPAAKWALGSLLLGLGTALVAAAPHAAILPVVLGRSLLIYVGLTVFGIGIIEACTQRPAWRGLVAALVVAFFVHACVSAMSPSLLPRLGLFAASLAGSEIYIACAVLRTPSGPLQATQRVIAILLLLQAAATLVLAAGLLPFAVTAAMHAHGVQIAGLGVILAATFLLILALTVLTGQRTTTLLSAVLDNLEQGVAMFDADRRLVICNGGYGALYGIESRQLRPGTPLPAIIAKRIANGFFAGSSKQRYFEDQTRPAIKPTTELHQLNDGRSIVVSRRPMPFGGWLTTHADVSQLRRIEEQVAYLAHHDPLTGLANRQLFGEKLREAIARLDKPREGFAVLLIDLDRFKAINDTLGHPSGDALLVAVAERFRSCVGEADILARLGGDEFAIVQMRGPGHQATLDVVRRLLKTTVEPYELNGQKVMIGISIGVTKAPENGADVDQLMRNADLALYRAKAEGRNCYRFYDRDMDATVRARHSLELALRSSILNQDFCLDYQPIIDVEGREARAAEALVRWRHPSGQVIEPARFIGIAEETGLIVPLGEWILAQACADAVAWPETVRVTVNLSVVQISNGDLCETVENVLRATGLPPHRLELEVTESIFLHHGETTLARLHQLKQAGISIALDDFGTGYSSLNYLTKFPFDRIKIDKSFIVDLGSRAECSAIVAAIMGVARSLDMATTAEGVETIEQYDLLHVAGCREMQGYLFGRPRPVEDLVFSAWNPGLDERGVRRAEVFNLGL